MNLSTAFASLRKQIAGISLVTLVAGMLATGVASAATSQTFSDVPADAWYATYVNGLADLGVVDSTKDMYRPGDLVNRAEMAKWAFFVSGLPMESATSAPYKDVPMGQWYTDYIYTLTKNGIVSGDKKDGVPTGWFRPSDALNRAEASKMLVNAAQMAEDLSGAPHFPDVTTSAWYYNFVETLFANGVVAGYPDGMFRPANNINRAEAAKMVYLSINPVSTGFTLDSAAAASKTTVELIFSMNVDEASAEMMANYDITNASGDLLNVTGATMTAPDTVVLTTATQAANVTYEVVATSVKSAAGDDLANTDAVSFLGYGSDVSGGDLEVSLSTQTPVAGSVPSGATGVVFTCWDFMASGADDAMIKSLHVTRVGPGTQTDFANVYLYNGDARLTTGRSINSETQMVEFNNINQTVQSGDNMKLCLVADLVPGASGGVHAFQIAGAAHVMSNSSAMTGSFPLRGADQLITSAVVGTTTIRKNGSLDEVTVGQVDARIAQFELEADGKEDQNLSRIALYIRGSVTVSDLKNFRLYAADSDTVLATAATVGTKDLVTLTLATPYKIGRGEKKIFHVLVDMSPGRDGDNIKTYLDENTDLSVIGKTFGYGTKVISTAFDGSGTCPGVGCMASFVVIKGSTFNVSFTGPTAGEVAVGQKSGRCMDMTITNGSGSSVDIKDWVVTLSSTDSAAQGDSTGLYNLTSVPNFTLIKLTQVNDDGSTGGALLGPAELPVATAGNDASQAVILTGSATIDAGESLKTAIVFDIANDPLSTGTKVRCTLQNLTTTPDSVRDENGDFLTASSITPSSDIVGNLMTVTASALTVSAASSPSSTSYSRGTLSAPLLGIQFKAGSALDETVKSITLTGNTTAGVLKDIIDSNVALYDSATGGTAISTFKNITSTVPPTITFNNLNILVTKNSTKTIYLRGNVSNSAAAAIVRFFVAASTDVIAIDQNGQTASGVDVSAIDTALEAPAMTITTAGSGTVAQGTVTKNYVAAASKTFEASRFKFTAKDGTAMLQDLDLVVDNDSASSVMSVKLQKLDTATSTCVDFAGGAAISPASNGVAEFNNIGLDLSNTADTTLCGIVTTNAVVSTGEPSSGSNVGLTLFNVTEVSSGSGDNVAVRYVTDVTKLAMVGTGGITAVDLSLTNTALATDDIDTTGSSIGALVMGDVLQIDDEMILVVVGGSPATVVRGYANTLASSHAAGASVGKSFLTSPNAGAVMALATPPTTVLAGPNTMTGGAGFAAQFTIGGYYFLTGAANVTAGMFEASNVDLVGNVVTFRNSLAGNLDPILADGAYVGPINKVIGFGAGDTAGDVLGNATKQYFVCLNTGCTQTQVLGNGFIAASPVAPIAKNKLHGPLSRLYRSVPDVTLHSLPATGAGSLTATTVVADFNISPQNSSVTFNNDVDTPINSELIVHYTASNTTLVSCILKEVGGSTVDDADLGTANLIAFDFDNQGSPYSVSSMTEYQVECNIGAIVSPANVSTQFVGTDDPFKWNDGNVEVTGAGTALFPTPTTSQTTSST